MPMSFLLRNESYDAALNVFEGAIEALCNGDATNADKLLLSLDRKAIERDRGQLREFARTAKPFAGTIGQHARASRTIPDAVKEAVSRRDGYHCRFTGRRLIDTRLFKEVARVSEVFHFDKNHSVRETKRGAGGHPIVRTHGAAFEHAGTPHAFGGLASIENLALISVELNEGKSHRVLELLEIPETNWKGLTEYLPRLRGLPSIQRAPIGIVPHSVIAALEVAPPSRTRRLASFGGTQTSDRADVDVASGCPKDKVEFHVAFKRFWEWIMEELSARREVLFTPHRGNPRRVSCITSDILYLVETTERGGGSQCGRIELRNDFIKLANDTNLRSDSLQNIRRRHGIRNFVEFKRDMFEQFERRFLAPPAV